MNPKLLEIWKEVRYTNSWKDTIIMFLFMMGSFITYHFEAYAFFLVFGLVSTFQLISYFGIVLADYKIVDRLSINKAKRIFKELGNE